MTSSCDSPGFAHIFQKRYRIRHVAAKLHGDNNALQIKFRLPVARVVSGEDVFVSLVTLPPEKLRNNAAVLEELEDSP